MHRPPHLASAVLLALALVGCKYPYPGDIADAANACTPSTTTCTGNTLTVCDATGQPSSTTTCAFGCFTGGDRCADLAPSNGLGTYLDQAKSAAPLVIDDADLDTTALTLNNAPLPFQTTIITSSPVDVLVIIASDVDIGRLIAHGSRALAIASDGDVHVHHTIAVGAGAFGLVGTSSPGAGASPANDPACTSARGGFDASGHGGAGGGGYGTAGGRGGNGGTAQGGAGGGSAGNETIIPLRGGCAGTSKSLQSSAAIHGGTAGGALQISTRGHVILDAGASLSALGGAGTGVERITSVCPYAANDPDPCDAGSGGGAGGAILVEAARLELPPTAGLAANGGSGACGWLGSGNDGAVSELSSGGQDCVQLSGVGSGGNGGAGSGAGANGGAGANSGGGGGGGAGRIRINLPAGVTFDPGPPIVSPTPSLGRVGTR